MISHNSVCMDPVKVAGVSEWPVPSNKKEVQSFLGFTNFYRRFIQYFSHQPDLSLISPRKMQFGSRVPMNNPPLLSSRKRSLPHQSLLFPKILILSV